MESVLSESDVRAMVRLIGEVASRPEDHMGKKRFLMEGLCNLIDGDCWVWALMCQPGDGQPQVYVNHVHGGFDEERFSKLIRAIEHPEMSWVAQSFFQELAVRNAHVTRGRHQIISDEDYFKTEASQKWEEAGIGSLVMSTVPFEENSGSTIGIYRRVDQPDFTDREIRIAHIVLSEVPWLHELGWPDDRGVTVPKLQPQQRVVLVMLLEGLDRKTIARHLGISIHTVGGYCKEIYRFFDVSSHVELMTRFYQGNGGDQPSC